MTETFGKYEIVRLVGRGGMGVVHQARDTVLDRHVALKMMSTTPDDPVSAREDEERFLREARLSASLPKHPNIVGVYEAGVLDGVRFIAMEFIDGQPMSRWRREKGVPLRDQVRLLRDVALAVDVAHRHRVVHRDLKPENILVDAAGQPHVTDFGLAKALGADVTRQLTQSGMIVGTPAYMSPEQARAQRDVNARTDVWALGVMLYEIVSGRQPFTGDSTVDILIKASTEPPPPLEGIDPSIAHVCLKALSKEPDQRHAGAGEFANDLARWLAGRTARAPAPAPPARSRRAFLAAGAGAALLLGTGLAVALRKRSRPTPAPSPPNPTDMRTSVRLGFLAPPRLRFAVAAHAQGAFCVAFSPDATVIASGGQDRIVRLSETRAGEMVRRLEGHEAEVRSIVYGRALQEWASLGAEPSIRVWDAASGTCKQIESGPRPMWQMAMDRAEDFLACACEDGTIRIVSEELEEPLVLAGHLAGVRCVAFSASGATLASGGADGTVRLWLPRAAREVRAMTAQVRVECVAFSPDDSELASAGADGAIRLWETSTGALLRTIAEAGTRLAYSPDGHLLVSGGQDGILRFWDPVSGVSLASVMAHAGAVEQVAFDGGGAALASTGRDGKVAVWDVGARCTLAGVWRTIMERSDRVLRRRIALERTGGAEVTVGAVSRRGIVVETGLMAAKTLPPGMVLRLLRLADEAPSAAAALLLAECGERAAARAELRRAGVAEDVRSLFEERVTGPR